MTSKSAQFTQTLRELLRADVPIAWHQLPRELDARLVGRVMTAVLRRSLVGKHSNLVQTIGRTVKAPYVGAFLRAASRALPKSFDRLLKAAAESN